MIKYKGKEVTSYWILEQVKLNKITRSDLKYISVEEKEKKKAKPKQPITNTTKGHPFNFFIKDQDLKGRKLFGVIVHESEGGKARLTLDTPIPVYDMVEIPVECAFKEEREVIGIIRRARRSG